MRVYQDWALASAAMPYAQELYAHVPPGADSKALGRDERITVPTAVALFVGYRPPRAWAERAYNLQRWTELGRGGHFAALEEPELLVDDMRAFFRAFR